MKKATAKAILHLLDIVIKKGLHTREGRDALITANHWLYDINHNKGGAL